MKYVDPNSFGNVNGRYKNTERVFTSEVLRTRRMKSKASRSARTRYLADTPRVRALEYLKHNIQKIPVKRIYRQETRAGFGNDAKICREPRQSLSKDLMVPRSVHLTYRNIRHNSGSVRRLFHFSFTKLPRETGVGDRIKLCNTDSVIYAHTFPLWLWRPGMSKTIFEIEIPTRIFDDGVTRGKIRLTSFYPIIHGNNLSKNLYTGDKHSIYTTVVMSDFSATIKKIEQQPMPCTVGNHGPNPQGGRKINNRFVMPGAYESKSDFLTSHLCSVMYVTVRIQSFK